MEVIMKLLITILAALSISSFSFAGDPMGPNDIHAKAPTACKYKSSKSMTADRLANKTQRDNKDAVR